MYSPHELPGEPWRDFPQKHLCLVPCVEVVHLFQPTSYARSQLCWSDMSTELEYLERASAYTTPKECYDAALFLRLGLPSTLIRHKKLHFWKHRLLILCGRKTLMMELFENDVDTIITRFFYWPSFPRTQIPNDRWLLVIVVRPAQWTETFDTFSEWNLRFPIGQFTVVCLVTWPWMQARLKVTLLWYRPLYFSHVNAK